MHFCTEELTMVLFVVNRTLEHYTFYVKFFSQLVSQKIRKVFIP